MHRLGSGRRLFHEDADGGVMAVQMTQDYVAVFGDMHGNVGAVERAIEWAANHDLKHAVWAGDCGLWPGVGGIKALDIINALGMAHGVVNYWVGGNHEWWPEWNRVVADAPRDDDGFAYL